ncbi:MAG: DUF1540 domain-containing protein [Clostridiales bacterium]|nr:DUF1540 domain-containing protein [Clostridiales bacterium]
MAMFDNRLSLRPDTIPRHISGITCDARNCIYHDGDNYCTAKHITVGSVIATNSAETRCATFEARGNITRQH